MFHFLKGSSEQRILKVKKQVCQPNHIISYHHIIYN